MTCPRCHAQLIRRNEPPFLLWACRRCGGCAATLAALRRGIRHDYLQQAWARSLGHDRRRRIRCPGCDSLMNVVPDANPEIDLCRTCQMMWFDAGELAELPRRPAGDDRDEKWRDELRQMQRRRQDREFYDQLLRRARPVMF